MNTQELKSEKFYHNLDKKNWVSPEITNWENENIENSVGLGADGGSKAYAG
ncbi:hypothetical protein G9H62_08240 [Aquirufa ecclesiirivi]|uniref:hypothetical protein n=1 Tax=Aquirufa ecclesiirivi TaxID=2715124 RepID=UPI0022A8C1FC|nr:hypothetical protein [Aquirufa ecclesiirivi]MCZ2472825.1 hypothetical protein [Aquirufa ecclesiirivi]